MHSPHFAAAVDWLTALGPVAGPALFVAVFIVANAALVPASLFTLAAGYAFGFGLGLPLCAIARPAAAAVGYGLSRTWLRGPVARHAARYPMLTAVDRAIAGAGLRIVLLLRLSPLFPSTITNYLLGATRLRFMPFVVGSAVGTLPSTLLGVSAGAGLSSLSDAAREGRESSPLETALLIVGLLATAGLAGLLYRAARRELAILLTQATPAPTRAKKRP